MTTQTWLRVQDGDRDTSLLLDPECWTSESWGSSSDDSTRHGVSVMASREELAEYLGTHGQGIGYGSGGWVLVELTGEISGDRPVDAQYGEYLIIPDAIIAVSSLDDDAEMWDMIGDAYDAYAGGQ